MAVQQRPLGGGGGGGGRIALEGEGEGNLGARLGLGKGGEKVFSLLLFLDLTMEKQNAVW